MIHSASLVLLGDFTVEFYPTTRRLLVLQHGQHVREELMAIMLHGRHELAADQVLEWRRVEHGLTATVVLERFLEEGCDAVAIFERVRHGRSLSEPLIRLRKVVVAQLIYRQQALKTSVHVAV